MDVIIEKLKSAKTMFDNFEDLSLGFVPSQIETVEKLVSEFEQLDPQGFEQEIFNALTPDERQSVIKAYCFTTAHKNNKFMFLRIKRG